MEIKPVKTKAAYRAALKEIESLSAVTGRESACSTRSTTSPHPIDSPQLLEITVVAAQPLAGLCPRPGGLPDGDALRVDHVPGTRDAGD